MNRRARLVYIAAGLAVTLFAARAVAQPLATELKYQVRVFDASTNEGWASAIDIEPGTRIEVRALVSYVGTGTVGGLGQIVFQPVLSNWTSVDTLLTNGLLGIVGPTGGLGPIGGTRSTPIGTVADQPGLYGRITPWGANATTTSSFLRGHTGTGTASGLLRIAQSHITNWVGEGATSGATANNNVNGGGGVSIAQIASVSRTSSDPAFSTATQDIVVFKFSVTLGFPGYDRMLRIDTPADGFNRVLASGQYVPNIRWFASENEATPSVQSAAYAVPAFVTMIPTPGALWLAGAGAVAMGRRRRR